MFLLALFIIKEGKADTQMRYLYLFGGFPDIRFQGGGMVHPHSEMNPATLELVEKYDINLSLGFSSKYKSSLIKITDSKTSALGGAVYFKCLGEKMLCGGENSKLLSFDLSYSFSISDTSLGIGTALKWKLDRKLEKELGERGIFPGLGTVIKHNFTKFSLLGGVSLFYLGKSIAGGFGGGIYTEDIFSFLQIFYIERKIIPDIGFIVRTLTWFRVFLSYHGNITGGVAFVSPRLYLWVGYSTQGSTTMVSIGVAL